MCNSLSSRILGYLPRVIPNPAGYYDIYHVLYQIQRDIRISTICNTKSSGIIGYLPCVIPPKSSGILGYLSCVIPNPAGY